MGEHQNKLGFVAALAVALGTTIGAGVFALTETAIGHSGQKLPLSFALGVLPVLFTLAPIAMLAGAIPTAGGSYKYTSRLIAPSVAFGVVWLFAIGTFMGAFPLYSLSCVDYIESLAGVDLPDKLIAIGLLTAFYLVNVRGAVLAGFVEALLVGILVAALVVFVGNGAISAEVTTKPYGATSTGGVLVAASILSFAFMGGNALIELGHEIKRPGLTIPLAMGVCLAITLVLYTLVGIVTVRAGAESLLAAADHFMSRPVRNFFIVGGAITALCTTLNAYFLWGTKSVQVLCKDGVFPASWGADSRWATPARILTGIYVLSVGGVLLPLSRDSMSAFGSMSGLVVLVPVLIAAVRLPKKCPTRYAESLLKIPTAVVIPAVIVGLLVCLAALASVASLMIQEPWTLVLFGLWSAAGVALWFARRSHARFDPEPTWV